MILRLLLLFLQAPPPGQLFDEAVAALARGDYDAAEAGFQSVLRAQPTHIGALGNLGVTYSRRERFDQASETYRRALRLAPDDAGLLVNLGLSLLKQQRHREARAPLERLAKLQPGHRQGRELLATALLYSGRVAEAMAALEPLGPAPSPGVLYLLGTGALKLGDRTGAAQLFAQLESALPAGQAAFLRGKAYYESGLFEEAERELSPLDTTDARRELAKVFVSQRKGDEAEALFRRVLLDKPADSEAAYFLGALLVERGEIAEGEKHLRLAQANSGFWGTHYYLGKAALKRNAAAEAAAQLSRANALRPGDVNVLYQLARAQQASGDRTGASRTSLQLKTVREKQREGEQQALVLRD